MKNFTLMDSTEELAIKARNIPIMPQNDVLGCSRTHLSCDF